MRVTFIHHSCFVIETEEKALIFDWFNGERVNGYHFGGVLPEFRSDMPVYVFASHKHQDHFDMDVLRLAEKYANIRFIFSKDCKMSPHFLEKHGFSRDIRDKILYVTISSKYQVDDLKIETFRSTDAGVAFLVETEGIALFHAGDLNNWRWEGVGDIINGKMEREYKSVIRRLSDRKIRLAFIPLDPRQGQHQSLGLDYFLKNTNADYVFPMHMWQDYSGIATYKKRLSNASMAERVIEITQENQTFEIGNAKDSA